jgi:N-acetylmuramoyl-L-alanine amidase
MAAEPALSGAPVVVPQSTGPDQPGQRRYRRRNFNRYPGPIPTPEEWVPPEGPVRIALQAGHWRASEAPDELRGLRDNGTSSRGKPEWEVNLDIARRTAAMLEPLGYEVDILPAVVPPDYRAHLFISIHADGSNDPRASGFRVGSPRQDATGRASQAAELLQRSYRQATGLRQLPDVTRRMSNYYAFNFRRYEHALHPMTIAVILETGFLTSASDWGVIVDDPDRAARGIVAAVTAFDVTPPPVGSFVASSTLD